MKIGTKPDGSSIQLKRWDEDTLSMNLISLLTSSIAVLFVTSLGMSLAWVDYLTEVIASNNIMLHMTGFAHKLQRKLIVSIGSMEAERESVYRQIDPLSYLGSDNPAIYGFPCLVMWMLETVLSSEDVWTLLNIYCTCCCKNRPVLWIFNKELKN